jgi:hypothetical protein
LTGDTWIAITIVMARIDIRPYVGFFFLTSKRIDFTCLILQS